MIRFAAGILTALVLTAGGLSAGEVKFTAEPKAAAEGKKVKITFKLSAPTDVAVGVVNSKGVVVKHLAGGLLGPKAPKPLARGKLAQTLYWDRTDDMGKPVPAGKYTVQVQAGMKPVFDRVIAYEPRALSHIQGLTVGPKGELFVLNVGGYWTESYKPAREILVFSREFKYLRTLLPCPGDLPVEKLKGISPVMMPDGQWVPKLHNRQGRAIYPGLSGRPGRQAMLVTPDGWLRFTNRARELVRIRADNGAVPEPFFAGMLVGKKPGKRYPTGGHTQQALSKDGKWVYAANVGSIQSSGTDKLIHAVFRRKLGGKGPSEVFLGELHKSGKDKKHLDRPQGVAVDGEGNILVSDWGNGRVVVFSPAGKYLKEFPVDGPDHLCVDRKRGTIYVLAVSRSNIRNHGNEAWVRWVKKKLIKIKSWKDPKVLGEMSLAARGNSFAMPVMALDDQADPPILWIGEHIKWSLSRLVDKTPAGKLSDPEVVASAEKFPQSMSSVEHIAVDPATERLYVREYIKSNVPQTRGWHAYDGNTGKTVVIGKIEGAELAVGPDGYLYTYRPHHWRKLKKAGAWILRWDRDGKPANFEGSDRHWSDRLPRQDECSLVDREGIHGFGMSPAGEAYVIHSIWDRTSKPMWLSVVGRDGKIKKANLLSLTDASCGPQVDRDGNVYVMDGAVPRKLSPVPPEFADQLKDRYTSYLGMFGSVIKFPPAGGGVYLKGASFRKDPKTKKHVKVVQLPEKPLGKRVDCYTTGIGRDKGCAVDNATWIRPYIAPTPSTGCICFPARMSLDRYGRLFVPVAPARRFEVIDTEGNLLCKFGRYGNADNGGKDSPRPVKGVPLNWAYNVTASDKAVYIADTNNRRILKVRLDYRVSALCPVP